MTRANRQSSTLSVQSAGWIPAGLCFICRLHERAETAWRGRLQVCFHAIYSKKQPKVFAEPVTRHRFRSAFEPNFSVSFGVSFPVFLRLNLGATAFGGFASRKGEELNTVTDSLFLSHPDPMWIYDLETLRFLAV
ncbi:MAG: hypothetical protein ACEPO2_01960, partial [Pelagibaca sp.]